MKLPLCIPAVSENEIGAVKEVLEGGWLAHGEMNAKFERKFQEYNTMRRHAEGLKQTPAGRQENLDRLNIQSKFNLFTVYIDSVRIKTLIL